MPLPRSFTFFIGGFDELKCHKNRSINYFIGFNHPGQPPEYQYSYDLVSKELGEIDYFTIHEVHDAYFFAHKKMGCKMPDERLMLEIVNHAIVIKDLLEQGEQVNLLCACAAGISRSTAACYVILCYLLGEWNEREALSLIENKRFEARPNALMVKLADDLLGRKYKMCVPLSNHLDAKWFDKQHN